VRGTFATTARQSEMERYPIVDRCPVDVYVPSNMTYDYPFKLGKPSYASERIRKTCTTFIMDSGIGEDTTNESVLDMSAELDADFVVPCDELHDRPATTDAIIDFLNRWDDHWCRATPMLPLQPCHTKHYEDVPQRWAYMLGGISPSITDFSTMDVIEAVHRFRDTHGQGPYLHLLGVGASPRLVEWLGPNANMVDSVDVSTPEQCAINGRVLDTTCEQKRYEIRQGDGSSAMRASVARMSALAVNDAITKAAEVGQTGLDDW